MKKITLKVGKERGKLKVFEDETYVGLLEQLNPNGERALFEYIQAKDFDNWFIEKKAKNELPDFYWNYVVDKNLSTDEQINFMKKHYIPKKANFLKFDNQYLHSYKIDKKYLISKEEQAKYLIENTIESADFAYNFVFKKNQYKTSELIKELETQLGFKPLLRNIKKRQINNFDKEFEKGILKKINAEEEFVFDFEEENLNIDSFFSTFENQKGFKNFYKRLYLQFKEVYNEFQEEEYWNNLLLINQGGWAEIPKRRNQD